MFVFPAPRCLFHYWQSLKQYTLLPDQSVQPLPKDSHILNFLDAEAYINDGELFEEKDVITDHELAASDRRAKKEIRHLEAEVTKWQGLVDKVRGDSPPDFDNQTLAVLRGRLVRYLMRSKEITLGRTTKDQAVDVDLKLEGPAWKVSRRQGIIKLWNSGEFYISNEGSRCIFVDGRPVLQLGIYALGDILYTPRIIFSFRFAGDLKPASATTPCSRSPASSLFFSSIRSSSTPSARRPASSTRTCNERTTALFECALLVDGKN